MMKAASEVASSRRKFNLDLRANDSLVFWLLRYKNSPARSPSLALCLQRRGGLEPPHPTVPRRLSNVSFMTLAVIREANKRKKPS